MNARIIPVHFQVAGMPHWFGLDLRKIRNSCHKHTQYIKYRFTGEKDLVNRPIQNSMRNLKGIWEVKQWNLLFAFHVKNSMSFTSP